MEAKLVKVHPIEEPSSLVAMEVRIENVHIHSDLLLDVNKNYINPAKWKPLIMNFREYFGLGEQLSESRLAPVFGPVDRSK